MHGSTWRIPLTPEDVTGTYEIPITALECMTIVINLIVYGPTITIHPGLVIVLYSDSLTSVIDMADDSAQAELMRDVIAYLRKLPAFLRLKQYLLIQHGYGDTNIIADAKSRGYDKLVKEFAAQLGMLFSDAVIPAAAYDALEWLRVRNRARVDKRHRPLTEVESGTAKGRSDNVKGDGPFGDTLSETSISPPKKYQALPYHSPPTHDLDCSRLLQPTSAWLTSPQRPHNHDGLLQPAMTRSAREEDDLPLPLRPSAWLASPPQLSELGNPLRSRVRRARETEDAPTLIRLPAWTASPHQPSDLDAYSRTASARCAKTDGKSPLLAERQDDFAGDGAFGGNGRAPPTSSCRKRQATLQHSPPPRNNGGISHIQPRNVDRPAQARNGTRPLTAAHTHTSPLGAPDALPPDTAPHEHDLLRRLVQDESSHALRPTDISTMLMGARTAATMPTSGPRHLRTATMIDTGTAGQPFVSGDITRHRYGQSTNPEWALTGSASTSARCCCKPNTSCTCTSRCDRGVEQTRRPNRHQLTNTSPPSDAFTLNEEQSCHQ